MYLKNLALIQFKNYQQVKLDFSEEVNCFFGENGAGKTNLLDAIHYLCLTKSAFNSADSQQIKHGLPFFTLKGEFELQNKILSVDCVLEAGKKKKVTLNGKPYTRMSDHIGLLPVVLIAPDDTVIINGGSEERRRFFDNMICQTDQGYLQQLMRYQHNLKQRNALLKRFAEERTLDRRQLEPYDKQLITLSNSLFKSRLKFIEAFLPIFNSHYKAISGGIENVTLHYESELENNDFDSVFRQSLEKDLQNRRTSKGVHKDDFNFSLGGYPLKKFGSQGQKKSFLISLKLAQFFIFKTIKGTKPLLLLDDIFDKLDDLRINHLLDRVARQEFGQIFITDARPERSKEILSKITGEKQFYLISENKVRKE